MLNTINKTYNLYCDESSHTENDGHPFMLLSYIGVPYNKKEEYKYNINKIKDIHHYNQEIKWSKVSNSKRSFYFDLVDYFFSTDLVFRTVIIKKDEIKNSIFDQDHDTFYYKMYYQLIHHKIDMSAKYNIYIDIKDTLSANKIVQLKDILNIKYGVIRNLQNIHSHESLYIQLADFFMGAVNYKLRLFNKVLTKNMIISRIEKHCGRPINIPTYKSEDKFNLFFITLQ